MSIRQSAESSVQELILKLENALETASAICNGTGMRRYSEPLRTCLNEIGDEIARLIQPLQEELKAFTHPKKTYQKRRSPSPDPDGAAAADRSMFTNKRPRTSARPPATQKQMSHSPPPNQAKRSTQSASRSQTPQGRANQATSLAARSQKGPGPGDLYRNMVSQPVRNKARFESAKDMILHHTLSTYLVKSAKSNNKLEIKELVDCHFTPQPVYTMPEQIVFAFSQAVFSTEDINEEFTGLLRSHLTSCINRSENTTEDIIEACTSHKLALPKPGKKFGKSERAATVGTAKDLYKALTGRRNRIHSRNAVQLVQAIGLKYQQLLFNSIWSAFSDDNLGDNQIDLVKILYDDLPPEDRETLTLPQFTGVIKRIRDGASTMLLAFKTFGWIVLFHPALHKNTFQSTRFASGIRNACYGFQVQVDRSAELAAHMEGVKAAHWKILKVILRQLCGNAELLVNRLRMFNDLAGSLEVCEQEDDEQVDGEQVDGEREFEDYFKE